MLRTPRLWPLFGIVVLLATLVPVMPAASAPAAPPDPLTQLTLATGGALRVGYHRATGQVNFLATAAGQPWHATGLSAQAAPAARAESAARQFLTEYGALFGLKAAPELGVLRNVQRPDGRTYLRFQQQHAGVPVFGGELIVQLDAAQAVEVVIGEVQPDLDLATTPAIGAAAAAQTALAATAAAHGVPAASLQATPAALWIYSPGLTEPQGGPTRLVWRVEVTPLALGDLRQLVLIDAQHGGVALAFNQTHTALNRLTYTAGTGTTLPGSFVCNEADPTCAAAGSDDHAKKAHVYAGDTYEYYDTLFSRDSINDAGLTLISTVHYGVDYENAFWSGTQMVYGDGYGFPLADDVVAHELTHGVTQYESNLFYYYQSGAINEALSDVFGEFVDLTNGAGSDAAGNRWQVGEDISGLGALRDMEDPPLFSDPDRMLSAFYKSASGDVTNPAFDNGGVHTNSGLLNKAAFLLVDGQTFNGLVVSPIGLTKTAQIIYHTATNLLTSGSDYLDLYNALYSSCTSLIPQFGISAGDCQEVRDATDATEMDEQPVPNHNTHAPECNGVETVLSTLFTDGLEPNANNWTFTALSGASRWSRDNGFARTGVYSLAANDSPATASDSVAAMSSSVVLPANAYLHFSHAFGFDGNGPDGGVVEYSTNGGGSWVNAGGLFSHNGYNGTISAGPLIGASGFISDSHGYISSRLLLNNLAGQSVRFRFRMSTNLGGADIGWVVDDVKIYTCSGTVSHTYLPLILRSFPPSVGAWQTIVEEGFEGAWPSAGWTTTDPGFEQYRWAKRDCRAATGSFSAWAMGGGSSGGLQGCGANYINGAYSWMIYGPFDLSSAELAELRARVWLGVTSPDDLCLFGSGNGSSFAGYCYDESTGGVFDPSPYVLDLRDAYTQGDLTGDSSVWVAIVFRSDGGTTQAEGAYVDDVLLRQCLSGDCGALTSAAAGSASTVTGTPASLTVPAGLAPAER